MATVMQFYKLHRVLPAEKRQINTRKRWIGRQKVCLLTSVPLINKDHGK